MKQLPVIALASGFITKWSYTGWLFNNKHLCLMVLEAGNPRSGGCAPRVWREPAFWLKDSCLPAVCSCGRNEERALGTAFVGSLNPPWSSTLRACSPLRVPTSTCRHTGGQMDLRGHRCLLQVSSPPCPLAFLLLH